MINPTNPKENEMKLATGKQLATLIDLMERAAHPGTSPKELTASITRAVVGHKLTIEGANDLISFYTNTIQS